MFHPTGEPIPSLHGTRVVLVGRFAALSRHELAAWLATHGAVVTADVSAEVALVIVGRRAWPLSRSGRVPRALRLVESLRARGRAIAVLTEAQFAERCRAEQLPWPEAAASVPRILDFTHSARTQMLAQLLARGVSRRRLRRALAELSRWLPEALTAWEQLAPQPDGRRLLFRRPGGGLIEATGQRVFDFETPTAPNNVTLPLLRAVDGEALFAAAVQCEQRGDWTAAEEAYRRLLQTDGPEADVCFNLANVLVARGDRAAALERLWQAVELSPAFVEAWHNLGTVALDLGRWTLAERAFRRALALRPEFTAAQEGLLAATVQAASSPIFASPGEPGA